MPGDSPADAQFWLLVGDTPSGPFTASEVHGKLGAGDVTWETLACPLGGGEWLPLSRTPGIGPTVKPLPPSGSVPPPLLAALPAPVNKDPRGQALSTPATASREQEFPARINRVRLATGVALIGFLGWLVYEWARPFTAMEVCRKFNEAKTPEEAKKYATPRMQSLINALVADKTPEDPNDTFELTRETEGADMNSRRIGFTGTWYDAEAAQRVQVEGYISMKRLDGWKADDMFFTGVEGVGLPHSMSLVDEYRRSVSPATRSSTGIARQGTAADASREKKAPPTAALRTDTRSWFEKYGWKGIGLVAFFVIWAIGREVMQERRESASPSNKRVT